MLIRPVRQGDAAGLASLINEIIARGGTTAFQEPFTPNRLAEEMLSGPAVLCCFVAEDDEGRLQGFQTILRAPDLPDDIGDIATFARVDGTQKGVGTRLFERTCRQARALSLAAINATIRADNTGGLSFYNRLGFSDYDIIQGLALSDGTLVDRVSKRYDLSLSVPEGS